MLRRWTVSGSTHGEKPMLVSTGLAGVPIETIGSVLLVLMAASVIMGWICDALLEGASPGLGSCCVLCFIGMAIGLAVWGSFTPLRSSDVVSMLWVAVGSAFAAVLAFAAIRRAAS
jgi:hypothetical protein